MDKYNLVACGATFDRFHKGHKAFLRFALEKGKKVLLGLTSDTFAKEKTSKEPIESYNVREKAACNFLKEIGALQRIEILPIDNLFIPQQWENHSIDAIIVSKDVVAGALAINEKRKKEGKTSLEILYCPTVFAEDEMSISSLRIRNGEIDREGKLFISPSWTSSLKITSLLRRKLKKPFGMLIKDVEKWFLENQSSIDGSIIATVGDVATLTFNKENMQQVISVVDFFVARKKKFSTIKDHGFTGSENVINVENPAGFLTPAIFRTFKTLFNNTLQRSVIVVKGEEDLAVLPLTLVAPLGFTIYYGQPGEGIVEVKVTEARKEEASTIVKQFSQL